MTTAPDAAPPPGWPAAARRAYLHVPRAAAPSAATKLRRLASDVALAPAYWAMARLAGGPGLRFTGESVRLAVDALRRRGAGVSLRTVYGLLHQPMDSTRYFEFDFMWESVRGAAVTRYLDVSSPRLFPIAVLRAFPAATAELINPDANDLAVTRRLVQAAGLARRCALGTDTIEAARFEPGTFDLVTCISVLEHIADDRAAVERMWALVRPGGRLLISVPCSAVRAEQYIDENEYGVLATDESGFVFFQRFYDAELLAERVFAVTGAPARQRVFGERAAGAFQANAARKRGDTLYPAWREPYMMATEYRYFDALAELPGEGVVAMEFVKR